VDADVAERRLARVQGGALLLDANRERVREVEPSDVM
jgi:hypothetical protein